MNLITTNDSNLTKILRDAQRQGFEINIDNFEIEIYAPFASISASFNRNDPKQVQEAIQYIREQSR